MEYERSFFTRNIKNVVHVAVNEIDLPLEGQDTDLFRPTLPPSHEGSPSPPPLTRAPITVVSTLEDDDEMETDEHESKLSKR